MPLKYLRPDTAFSNYTITRKESSSNVEMIIRPDPNNSMISYTNYVDRNDYFWWLDADNNQTQNLNDIPINTISEMTVWLQDSSTFVIAPEQAWMVKGSDTKPLYFDFIKQNVVSDVKTRIESVYNTTIKPLDLQAYVKTLPALPDLSLFPKTE